MSDKEKRILVLEVSPDCRALRFDCDPFDEEDVVYCDKNGRWERITEKDCKKCKSPVLAGITRAEAVERMAKALCHRHCPEKVCTSCDEWEKYGTKEDAEAALDALLGDKK